MDEERYLEWRLRQRRRRLRLAAVVMALALLVPIVLSTWTAISRYG